MLSIISGVFLMHRSRKASHQLAETLFTPGVVSLCVQKSRLQQCPVVAAALTTAIAWIWLAQWIWMAHRTPVPRSTLCLVSSLSLWASWEALWFNRHVCRCEEDSFVFYWAYEWSCYYGRSFLYGLRRSHTQRSKRSKVQFVNFSRTKRAEV